MIDLKVEINKTIQKETAELRERILNLKSTMDGYGGKVAEQDASINFLKKQIKTQKKDLDEQHLNITREIE